jgi:hypothetical protein
MAMRTGLKMAIFGPFPYMLDRWLCIPSLAPIFDYLSISPALIRRDHGDIAKLI